MIFLRFIYKPNNDTGRWTTEIVEDDVLPDGFTDVCTPSTPTYKPYFNWETKEWEEYATQEEIALITNQIDAEPTLEERLATTETQIVSIEETIDVLFGGVI